VTGDFFGGMFTGAGILAMVLVAYRFGYLDGLGDKDE
jgi:hypothetical protein